MTDWIDCTGDIVTGDTVRWTEAVFYGSHRRPKLLGHRTITAQVVSDSYGRSKQQHTFTLLVVESEGCEAFATGNRILRKGRNIYRNGCERLPWHDESARRSAAAEKHTRGNAARQARDARKREVESAR